MPATAKRKEFGDFQTPTELATDLCRLVAASVGPVRHIVEPTCGIGNFARAALAAWPDTMSLHGFDINEAYVDESRANTADPRALFKVASFFTYDWAGLLDGFSGKTLIVGNLPWVTSSTIGSLGGTNLPEKTNFQARTGLDAITGKANFDISEWMLLKMVDWCDTHDLAVALLVKTGVARKVLHQAWQHGRRVRNAQMRRIDSKRWFGAAVDACLLVFESGAPQTDPTCTVFSEDGAEPETVLGYRDKLLIADVRAYDQGAAIVGRSPLRWRSGVKHDLSSVMEFEVTQAGLVNGLGELVDLEPTCLYPLFKSSQLARGDTSTNKRVLVPQRAVGEDTSGIAHTAPNTWSYLMRHSEALDARGSSIYRKNVRFAVFGIGPYSFTPYKVALSGLYKVPRFVILGEVDGRPAMVDDTAVFLSFDTNRDATIVAEALNSPTAAAFMRTFAFTDAKRPYTVELLSNIDLAKLITITHGANDVPDVLREQPLLV